MLRPPILAVLTLLGSILTASTAALAAAEPHRFPSTSAITRAGDLLGRTVATRDGEELGKVQDLALDLATGRVVYVVVAVGSFLIEDSLIAVDPEALRTSGDDDGRLLLEADAASLRDAQRFSADDWPLRADVTVARNSAPGLALHDEPRAAGTGTEPPRGSATISDGRRTATLSAGERAIRLIEAPTAEAAPATEPLPLNEPTDAPAAAPEAASPPGSTRSGAGTPPRSRFDRLDSDGNGALDRAEIAHVLTREDRFSRIDRNGDGTIQRDELDALMQSRQAPVEP
jgi:sporulation protein YlmC with PRC-barrel domain